MFNARKGRILPLCPTQCPRRRIWPAHPDRWTYSVNVKETDYACLKKNRFELNSHSCEYELSFRVTSTGPSSSRSTEILTGLLCLLACVLCGIVHLMNVVIVWGDACSAIHDAQSSVPLMCI